MLMSIIFIIGGDIFILASWTRRLGQLFVNKFELEINNIQYQVLS